MPRSGAEVKLAGVATRRRYAPRLPPEERRRQLLDATLRLIAEEGYQGVSMEAIARAAGVTKPVVYDLFGNLEGLLRELLDREERRALEQLDEVLAAATPDARPDQVLVEGVEAFIGVVTSRPEAWRLILMPSEATPAIVREHVERNRRRIATQLERLMGWGFQMMGGQLADADTELAAQGLQVAFEQAARLALTDPQRYPPERFSRFAATLMATVGVDSD
jgi:AcrR family transcriptional regulator